jgi:hypothetical protein
MQFNDSFRRGGSKPSPSADAADAVPDNFKLHTFQIVCEESDLFPPRTIDIHIEHSDPSKDRFAFTSGTVHFDRYFPHLVTLGVLRAMEMTLGIPEAMIASIPPLKQMHEQQCDRLFAVLLCRHLDGGCGREHCTNCANRYSPSNSKATIASALQFLEPVVTDFDMSAGNKSCFARFETNIDRTETRVTTTVPDPAKRADLDTYIAKVRAHFLSGKGEKGGAS